MLIGCEQVLHQRISRSFILSLTCRTTSSILLRMSLCLLCTPWYLLSAWILLSAASTSLRPSAKLQEQPDGDKFQQSYWHSHCAASSSDGSSVYSISLEQRSAAAKTWRCTGGSMAFTTVVIGHPGLRATS